MSNEELWFNTPDSPSLCRGGGNGPRHPSQIMGLSFMYQGESFLDVGCGSGATLETFRKLFPEEKYKGVDFIEKHLNWCKETFPKEEFEVQNAMSLKEADNSWDVVWSRHVVDHLSSFKEAIVEQLRVARKRVICVLWVPLGDITQIKNIVERDVVYETEYTNNYGKEDVLKSLEETGVPFRVIERVGYPRKKTDTVIVLDKEGL